MMHRLTKLKPERWCQIGGISKKVTGSAWTAKWACLRHQPRAVQICCICVHL